MSNVDIIQAQHGTQIFDENIHSLQVYHTSNQISLPLSSNDEALNSLRLSFDDFRQEVKTYFYTFIHCDMYWMPSNISQSEYIDGFYEAVIRDYKMSYNTLQNYVHYNLTFPTEDLFPTLSGNYLIKVYEEGKADNPAFVTGFMLVDKKVSVSANIDQASSPLLNDKWQEVDFKINIENTNLLNPTSSVKVVIRQNGRLDNQIIDLKPRSYKNNKLVYDYEKENVFQGGNEFRNLDITNFNFISEHVNKIRVYDDTYQVLLNAFPLRNKSPYIFVEDIDGQYIIETKEYDDSDTEADYAQVYFTLPADYPMVDGDLYVAGQFNHWKFDEENRMKYNYDKNWYEATLYLKQGYYNYMYMFKETNIPKIDLSLTENSFSETQNSYTFYVYYREPGGFYDQLICVETYSNYE